MKSLSNPRLHLLVGAIFLILPGASDACVPELEIEDRRPLVTIEKGDLPIILTAPHGGRTAIPGVPARKSAGVRSFVAKNDVNTDRVTEGLADAIEKRLGKRPYVVIARFHRKYVDANRPPELAFEKDQAQAKAEYEAFHQGIAEARRDILRRWGSGILLDIHGQSASPEGIYRGTKNGKAVSHLLGQFGKEALVGENSVFGHIAAQGVAVYPDLIKGDRETRYTGGFITVKYGSTMGGNFDAMQIELGRKLRAPEADIAERLGKSIVAFAEKYLPEKERKRIVRVGVYRDVGAGASVKGLMRALDSFDGVEVTELKADDIRSGALGKIDVLIQPGGSGGKQGRHLGADGRDKIRRFIGGGGGLIGICAGAYLASADYDWSLDVLDAKVIDRKHWARGKGTVEIAITTAGKKLLRTEKDELEIYYAQGPLLAPAGDPKIADYQVVAIYQTEIAKNGAPKGVMKGTTAIASGRFGHGRVICFSPHPEKTDGLEKLVHYAIEHVAP